MGFLAPASLALGALGTGIQAIGAISQGNTAAAEANYSAQVARNNQQIAQQYATSANEAGEVSAENVALRTRGMVASEVAAAGASGIDPTTGSAKATQTSTRLIGRTEAATVQQQGEMTGYGYQVEGTNYAAQAGLDVAQAGAAQEAGLLGAGGSLLGGASTLGARYAWMQQQGLFGSTPSPFFATGSPGVGTGGLY